jgi:hypothetical protein
MAPARLNVMNASKIGWYALQLGAGGVVFWFAATPEGQANGGTNGHAVILGAVLLAAAATAAVKIVRDALRFISRWVHGYFRRLPVGRSLPSQAYNPQEGRRSLSATAGRIRQPAELPPRVRLGKKPR